MILTPFKPLYTVVTATAADDNAFNLTTLDIWMEEADVFIYDQDCYIGNQTDQILVFGADEVYTIKGPLNIREIYVKNYNAGQNTRIAIAGTRLSDQQMIARGLA